MFPFLVSLCIIFTILSLSFSLFQFSLDHVFLLGHHVELILLSIPTSHSFTVLVRRESGVSTFPGIKFQWRFFVSSLALTLPRVCPWAPISRILLSQYTVLWPTLCESESYCHTLFTKYFNVLIMIKLNFVAKYRVLKCLFHK